MIEAKVLQYLQRVIFLFKFQGGPWSHEQVSLCGKEKSVEEFNEVEAA